MIHLFCGVTGVPSLVTNPSHLTASPSTLPLVSPVIPRPMPMELDNLSQASKHVDPVHALHGQISLYKNKLNNLILQYANPLDIHTETEMRRQGETIRLRKLLKGLRETLEQEYSDFSAGQSSFNITKSMRQQNSKKNMASVVTSSCISTRDMSLFQLRHTKIIDSMGKVFESPEQYLRRFEKIL